MITLIAEALASTGFTLLKNIIDTGTSKGLEKVETFIEDKTGISIKNTNMSNISTEDMEKIKECVLSHQLALANIALEQDRLSAADVANARHLQEETLKNGKTFFERNFIHFFASFVFTVPLVVCSLMVMYVDMTNPIIEKFVNSVWDTAKNLDMLIVAFYFGTTFRDADKKEFKK